MPELAGGEHYMLDALVEAGPALPGQMGPVPLSWQEIDAYARQTQAIDEPWEARTLIKMSAAYLEGIAVGENPFGIMPMDQDGSL